MKFEDIKIGDRVLRARGGPHGNYRIGDIGVVVELQSSNGHGIVKLSRDRDGIVHAPKNLELVEAAPDITVEQALAFLKTKGEVKFEPKFEPVRVYLNSTYDAIIYKDYVEVGCEKFPHSAVMRLIQAVNKVRNDK